MSRRRSKPVAVEHRPIRDEDRELRRQRQTFAERERARLGLSPKTQEQPRKRPARRVDSDIRALMGRGLSREAAEATLATIPTAPRRC